MFAGVQAGERLVGVHLRGRAQDHRIDVVAGEAVAEFGAHVADAVLLGDLLRLGELAANQRGDLDAVDQRQAVEVLDAEGAGAGESDADRVGHGNRG